MRLPVGFGALGRAFRLRNYRLYVIGSIASNIGIWVQRVALGWLAWQLTESTAWLGGIAVAEVGPMIAFGLIAGTIVDRMDYLKLLRLTQACGVTVAATITALVFADLMTIWILLAVTVLRGTILAFQRPSRMSLVYSLIGRELLPTGLAVNSMVFNGSRFVGPALGGAIIVAAGVQWTFATALALFLVMTVILQLISIETERRRKERASLAAETWDGFRYILGHPGIRMQMVLVFSVGFFARPFIEQLPAFASRVYAGDADVFTALVSAMGLGAWSGGFYLASRAGGPKGMTTITLSCMALANLGLLAFVATGALWGTLWVALPLMVLMGAAFIMQGIGNQTLIQAAVDPDFRGRVISLYGITVRGMPAIGALIVGAIAETQGLALPVAGGALLCLLVWAWAWRNRSFYADNLETETAAEAAPAKAASAD